VTCEEHTCGLACFDSCFVCCVCFIFSLCFGVEKERKDTDGILRPQKKTILLFSFILLFILFLFFLLGLIYTFIFLSVQPSHGYTNS
jgi:hypothetical protein